MPIYEYKCSSCGEVFEALVRGSQKPACPKCGKRRLKKLVSGFATVSQKKCPKSGGRRACAKEMPCCGGGHSCCCGR